MKMKLFAPQPETTKGNNSILNYDILKTKRNVNMPFFTKTVNRTGIETINLS